VTTLRGHEDIVWMCAWSYDGTAWTYQSHGESAWN
jgi:hypothetical protein